MAKVFKSFSRTSVGAQSSAYKNSFLYPEVEKEAVSHVRFAVMSEGEWALCEIKGLVFTGLAKPPEAQAVSLTKAITGWKVHTQTGNPIGVSDALIHVVSVENENVSVLMIPSTYDVRYRSTLIRVIGLIGRTDGGQIVLMGLDPKRFPGATEFEMIELESIWYKAIEQESEKQTSPGYCPPGGKGEPREVKSLSLSEANIEWYKSHGMAPDDFEDLMGDEATTREAELATHIIRLQNAAKERKSSIREAEVKAKNMEEHHERDDFITKSEVAEFGEKRLKQTSPSPDTEGKKAKIGLIKDLAGKEISGEIWKKTDAIITTGKVKQEEEERKKMNPFQVMFGNRHEE